MCVWLVKRPLLVSVSEAMLNHPNVDLLNAGMSLFLKLITVPITDQIGSLIHQLVTGITLSSPLLKIRSMLLHEYLHHATYSTVSPVLQDADSYSPDHDVTRKFSHSMLKNREWKQRLKNLVVFVH